MTTPPTSSGQERFTRETAETWSRFFVDNVVKYNQVTQNDYDEERREYMLSFNHESNMVVRTQDDNCLRIDLHVPNEPADSYTFRNTVLEVSRGPLNTTLRKILVAPDVEFMTTMYSMLNLLTLVDQDYHFNRAPTVPVS